MSEITNPHDKFFKETFGQVHVARDFLRNYLPAPVLAQLNLNEMVAEKETFIGPELQEHFSDLLFSVQRQDGQGLAYVYFLFEHKSYFDIWTWLQLLSYIVRFWEREMRQGARSLSPIIPLVIYHGREKWKGSRQLNDLYTGPNELKLYLPDFTYPLYDFSHLSDEEVRGETELQINLLILRHIFDGQLTEKLPEILALYRVLENQEKALQSLVTVLRYLTVAAERMTSEQMHRALQPLLRYEGDKLMSTLAQQWLEQGRQEGMQQGMEQGMQQGVQQGLRQGLQQGMQQELRQNIIELLNVRLQVPARRFRGRVENIDNLDTLRLLLRRAATVDDVSEFEQALDALTKQV